jgi:formylmethanofuran dehydrogenase subunit E
MNHDIDIEGVRKFHGHSCPGLTIGIRAAELALREIGPHAADEEVVAIVETDNCSVDAIQYLTGCTFGKGNLIYRNYGKNAYTFIRRSDNKAIRIVLRPEDKKKHNPESTILFQKVLAGTATDEERQRSEELRAQKIEDLLTRPLEDIFDIQHVVPTIPERARIYQSVTCAGCGETTMETRVRLLQGQPYCISCFEARNRKI